MDHDEKRLHNVAEPLLDSYYMYILAIASYLFKNAV